ncbi:MAG TPA: histidine ammonia-lyase, partial [Acholeplasmatales bacterium]|nr:histidine ammonia-lyase [Acholeplasmatales bacterium]
MIKITGQDLTLHSFMRVVRFFEKIELSEEATSKVEEANRRIKAIIGSGKTVYGVNTGFGKMSDVAISKADLRLLQENLLKSHACGVGEHFNEEVVRGIMLLRINALAKGYSGIRLKTLNQLMIYLNERIVPAIPEQGSLGASGDLAQLSHMGLTLLGLGEVYYENRLMPTSEALVKANLQPLSGLEAKEGLSLI